MVSGLLLNFLFTASILFFCRYRVARSARGNIVLKKAPNPMWVVVALYVGSAALALMIDPYVINGYHIDQDKWYDYWVYAAFVAIPLFPVLLSGRYELGHVRVLKTRSFRIVLVIMSSAAWFSVIYQAPFAYLALRIGADKLRGADGMHNLLAGGVLSEIAVTVSSFYLVYMFLFFISVSNRYSRLITVSLFVGSLGYVVNTLTAGGRTGAVVFIVSFAFMYSLFCRGMEPRQIKLIKKFCYTAIFTLFAVFVVISVNRFYHGGTNNLKQGTVGYLAEQPYTFAEAVTQRGSDYYGTKGAFPLFNDVVYGGDARVSKTFTYQWKFGTYLTDFYLISGWTSLLVGVFCVTAFFWFSFLAWRGRRRGVIFIIMYLFYFQFLSTGVFYFILGSRSGNLYVLLLPFLAVVLNKVMRLAPNEERTEPQMAVSMASLKGST